MCLVSDKELLDGVRLSSEGLLDGQACRAAKKGRQAGAACRSAVAKAPTEYPHVSLMLQVSISQGISGDTVRTFTLKLEPRELFFADKKEEGAQTRHADTTVSINVGGRNLYLVQASPLCWLNGFAEDTAGAAQHSIGSIWAE